MHARLARSNESPPVRDVRWPLGRPAFWCGVLLVALGLFAAAAMADRMFGDSKAIAVLLVAAGAIEAFAGILDHRAGRRTASIDVVLGVLSIAAGSLLLTDAWHSAASLVNMITLWLAVRGMLDLAGSALMRSAFIRDARMIRASIDLILGLLSWVALLVVPWWELLFGWPESSVSLVRMFTVVSVVAAGAFLVAESRIQEVKAGLNASGRSI